MAISNLPRTGVQAVVEGVNTFIKDITTVNNAIDNSGKVATKAAQGINPFNKSLDTLSKSVTKTLENFSKFAKESLPFGDVIGGITDKIALLPVPVLAAGAAVVALGKAFIDLGMRGAPLIGLAQSFDTLTASIGLSSKTLLKDLREASAGTVADFDLIRQANIALAGATGEFGKQFGQNLPKILEIARVQARATGQDVGYLYQSLVTGIKRASPMLIDNTGITLKIGEANEAYAQSIGKTVSQLSEQDKQMAVLNATLATGQVAIDNLGNAQETNTEKLARANATITNIFDGLAVAVQPAFGVVLDAVQKVLNIFQQLAEAIGPIFGNILSVISGVFGTIVDVVTSIAQPIIDVISSIAPYVALAFQTIANIIGIAGKIIGDVVGGIVRFLSDVAKNFFGLDLKNLGPQLFNGAAAAFGSFANGIIAVANKLIFPAVIGIAKFIADFLIGFSPPKEGPLSVIDKGGENLMKAWLEGISGVSLDPVKEVAAQVSDLLGNVGKQSLKTVTKRLALLDKALLPFQNRLDIVKASFDALNEPAKLALDAIDRETAKLQEAVAQGDPAATERLRILDQQRDTIQSQVDLQQGIVDRAQIQLGLAKAQQAPERALLNIRKAYLESLIKKAPAAAKEPGAATMPREKAGGGPAPINAPTPGGGATPIAAGAMPSVLDLIGGQGAVDEAAAGLSDAFMGAIDQSNLEEFVKNQLDLSTQFDRIKSVDLGAKIGDKFKGLTDAFNPDVEGSIANKIRGFVSTLTGDENTEGSIASFFSDIPGHLTGAQTKINDALSGVSSLFDVNTPDSPMQKLFALGEQLGGGVDEPGSILNFLSGLPANLEAAKPNLIASLKGTLTDLFDPEVEGSPAQTIVGLVQNLTGNSDLAGSIASYFADLPSNASDAASNLFDDLQANVFKPVSDFLNGDGAGTLQDVLNQAVNLIGDLPAQAVEALRNFGAMIYNAIVVPIINVMNAGIGALETGIRNIATFFGSFLGDIINKFDTTEIAGTNLGGLVPQALRDFQGNLAAAGTSFTIGRISTELPAFLAPPGGASGGIFSPGLMKVGERGPELMFNSSKMGVIPNQLTNVLMDLSAILAAPQPMPVMSGNSYNNSESNSSFIFNGVSSDQNARQRYNYLRAGMR